MAKSRKRFLFTSLPTDDLGLLTRSLPIAKALSERGHSIVFSNPAQAPRKVIADAGFDNLIPRLPLYEFVYGGLRLNKLLTFLTSREVKAHYGGASRFVKELVRSLPLRSAPSADEVWDTDHASAIAGLLNPGFVKAQCLAYINVIAESQADAVIDFWNPFACIASRKLGRPLITVNQGDALPGSRGFIWWKQKPGGIPTVVPVLNKVLHSFDLRPICKLEELNVGDLTLVV